MTKKHIKIKSKDFFEVDSLTVVIPDCTVDTANKLVTERNQDKDKPSSGERRLYLFSRSSEQAKRFFQFNDVVTYGTGKNRRDFDECSNNCYLLQENLEEYMRNSFKQYNSPSFNYFYDIRGKYLARLEEVKTLPDLIEFKIFDHVGKDDGDRFYINSVNDKAWQLIRKLALPKITVLSIYKMQSSSNETIYLFELHLKDLYVSSETNEMSFETVENLVMDTSVNGNTEKEALVKVRNGQAKFKENIFKSMQQYPIKGCPFTQITDRNLLRASHIKPWKKSNDQEKLDGFNGLLLTPTYDTLFDRGLISFEDNGKLLISPLLSKDTREKLNLIEGYVYEIYNSTGKRSPYLAFHRQHIFISKIEKE